MEVVWDYPVKKFKADFQREYAEQGKGKTVAKNWMGSRLHFENSMCNDVLGECKTGVKKALEENKTLSNSQLDELYGQCQKKWKSEAWDNKGITHPKE